MAIIRDKKAHEALAKIVGRRLRAARLAAGMDEMAAAGALGHRNATQVCLAESGGRVPPLLSMTRFADAYGVSVDYLTGRIDDPLADPLETNQGAIKRSLVSSVEGCVNAFVDSVAHFAVSSVIAYQQDRADIQRMKQRVDDVQSAYSRLVALNPSFEDDVRGSARLASAIEGLSSTMKSAADRLERDGRAARIRLLEAKLEVSDFSLQP